MPKAVTSVRRTTTPGRRTRQSSRSLRGRVSGSPICSKRSHAAIRAVPPRVSVRVTVTSSVSSGCSRRNAMSSVPIRASADCRGAARSDRVAVWPGRDRRLRFGLESGPVLHGIVAGSPRRQRPPARARLRRDHRDSGRVNCKAQRHDAGGRPGGGPDPGESCDPRMFQLVFTARQPKLAVNSRIAVTIATRRVAARRPAGRSSAPVASDRAATPRPGTRSRSSSSSRASRRRRGHRSRRARARRRPGVRLTPVAARRISRATSRTMSTDPCRPVMLRRRPATVDAELEPPRDHRPEAFAELGREVVELGRVPWPSSLVAASAAK